MESVMVEYLLRFLLVGSGNEVNKKSINVVMTISCAQNAVLFVCVMTFCSC